MSKEGVNGQPISKVITKINKIATKIRDGIPSTYYVNLEERLATTFVKRKRRKAQNERRCRSEYVKTTCENHASKLYLQILDHSCHLFITFILAISLRICMGFKIEEVLQHDWAHVRTNESIETMHLIKSIVVRRSFSENPTYIKFMNSMFPIGLLGFVSSPE